MVTFALFRAPAEDPVDQGFHDRNDAILEVAERSADSIGRSGYDDEPGTVSWGQQVFSRFYVEKGEGWTPATLSLWADIDTSGSSFNFKHPFDAEGNPTRIDHALIKTLIRANAAA